MGFSVHFPGLQMRGLAPWLIAVQYDFMSPVALVGIDIDIIHDTYYIHTQYSSYREMPSWLNQ